MAEKVISIAIQDEFRICPQCGYKDGFHTMLKKDGDHLKWFFICPSCHQIYDIGYQISGTSIKTQQ